MRLTFEYTKTAGTGFSPQAVHMMDNGLRFIYLTSDGLVAANECFPDMGLYDELTYKDKGRISADFEVSRPQLKKVAHHGAYGFWSSEDTHRFVIYMLPYNVSATLVDGSISFTKDSPVSQLSISFMNIGGELVGRYRSVISPNTMLELSFTMGSSEWLPLGQFYIDRVSTSYPEETISVSARNSIGKLLKEQTFDENNSFEICEDGLTDASYFNAVYKEAVELCVYLCKQFNLTEKDIICHSEGYKLGIASNHGDVMHWFPKHGKSMDTFRADVKAGLAATEAPAPVTSTAPKKYYRVQVGAYSVKANADAMLTKLKAAGFTDAFIKYSE